MRGVRRGRADLLPTGAIVLATVADALGLEGFTVSDWGLREGVLLEALQRRAGKAR
jgi:exopolyphosphatase/pppGpp-phosphohydrolase